MRDMIARAYFTRRAIEESVKAVISRDSAEARAHHILAAEYHKLGKDLPGQT